MVCIGAPHQDLHIQLYLVKSHLIAPQNLQPCVHSKSGKSAVMAVYECIRCIRCIRDPGGTGQWRRVCCIRLYIKCTQQNTPPFYTANATAKRRSHSVGGAECARHSKPRKKRSHGGPKRRLSTCAHNSNSTIIVTKMSYMTHATHRTRQKWNLVSAHAASFVLFRVNPICN